MCLGNLVTTNSIMPDPVIFLLIAGTYCIDKTDAALCTDVIDINQHVNCINLFAVNGWKTTYTRSHDTFRIDEINATLNEWQTIRCDNDVMMGVLCTHFFNVCPLSLNYRYRTNGLQACQSVCSYIENTTCYRQKQSKANTVLQISNYCAEQETDCLHVADFKIEKASMTYFKSSNLL